LLGSFPIDVQSEPHGGLAFTRVGGDAAQSSGIVIMFAVASSGWLRWLRRCRDVNLSIRDVDLSPANDEGAAVTA
jgi:hypothetical protein